MSEAVYFDGLSAARRAVALRFEAEALAVEDKDSGAALARWRYARLSSAERVKPGRLARLACADAPTARLHVSDAAAIAELLRRAPQLARGGDELSWRGIALAAVLSIAALAGFYLALPYAVRPLAKAIPLEWERGIGRQIADALTPARSCHNEEGWDALNAILAPLMEASGLNERVLIGVFADERNNAFAAPGAHIAVFHGLIAQAETPEEVAGVLAHELGHVIERHPTAALVRTSGLQALSGALFGEGVGSTLAGAGGLLLALSYSREDERAADAIAAEILDRAGVSKQGLARFFERLAKESGPALPAYVSTHPAPAARAARFADAPPREPILTPAQWQALKRICDD